MARTAFCAHIVYPNIYTVPVGKYAVFNAFLSSTTTTQGVNITFNGALIYYSQEYPFGGYSFTDVTVGPITANAGDVISTQSATRGGVTGSIGDFGINGFLYDTSATKIPFTSVVTQNSTSYTVPAGKIAVFNVFGINLAELYINTTPIAFVPQTQAIPTFYLPAGRMMTGPFVANAGDIISAGTTYASTAGSSVAPTAPAQFVLNGFLYPP